MDEVAAFAVTMTSTAPSCGMGEAADDACDKLSLCPTWARRPSTYADPPGDRLMMSEVAVLAVSRLVRYARRSTSARRPAAETVRCRCGAGRPAQIVGAQPRRRIEVEQAGHWPPSGSCRRRRAAARHPCAASRRRATSPPATSWRTSPQRPPATAARRRAPRAASTPAPRCWPRWRWSSRASRAHRDCQRKRRRCARATPAPQYRRAGRGQQRNSGNMCVAMRLSIARGRSAGHRQQQGTARARSSRRAASSRLPHASQPAPLRRPARPDRA